MNVLKVKIDRMTQRKEVMKGQSLQALLKKLGKHIIEQRANVVHVMFEDEDDQYIIRWKVRANGFQVTTTKNDYTI